MCMKFKGFFWFKKLNIIKMELKKDIFDFFKDNEYKLDEQLVFYVWRRLECKLDSNWKRNRMVCICLFMGQFGIVVGILLFFMVIMIMIFVFFN